MYIILIGCEYAGTTTLASAFNEWTQREMGVEFTLIHDHWKLPDSKPHGPDLTEEEISAFRTLSPRQIEVIQRHNLFYHTPGVSNEDQDFLAIGMHIEEKVYAPLYYKYGHRDHVGDRETIGAIIEQRIVRFIPRPVLVLVHADAEIIRQRMRDNPHPYPVVREEDVENVMDRFKQEFGRSLINRRIIIETSTATASESAAELGAKIEPHLNAAELARLSLERRD